MIKYNFWRMAVSELCLNSSLSVFFHCFKQEPLGGSSAVVFLLP